MYLIAFIDKYNDERKKMYLNLEKAKKKYP